MLDNNTSIENTGKIATAISEIIEPSSYSPSFFSVVYAINYIIDGIPPEANMSFEYLVSKKMDHSINSIFHVKQMIFHVRQVIFQNAVRILEVLNNQEFDSELTAPMIERTNAIVTLMNFAKEN